MTKSQINSMLILSKEQMKLIYPKIHQFEKLHCKQKFNPTGSNVYFERLRTKGGSFLPYPPFIIRFKGILQLSIQICIVQG